MFDDQAALDLFVNQLAQSLRRHEVEVACGPPTGGAMLAELIARLLGSDFSFTEPAAGNGGGPFKAALSAAAGRSRLLGKRVALVDDVMSAGSSLRATLTEVEVARRAFPSSSARCTCSAARGATFS